VPGPDDGWSAVPFPGEEQSGAEVLDAMPRPDLSEVLRPR